MIFSVVVGLCILNSLFDASFSLHTPAAGWKLLGCVCSFSISPAGGAKLTQTDCSCGEETLLLISQIQAIYHLTTSITITLPYQLNITNQSSIDHVYVCRTAAVARQAVSGLCDVTDFGRLSDFQCGYPNLSPTVDKYTYRGMRVRAHTHTCRW